jgi:RNA ligase (TIGR02306 family)
MERKLASIQKVVETFEIPEANSVMGCRVLGWQLVCKKEEFKPGDLCIFFEIDSILPDAPVFEFMRARKFRVKTTRFLGFISQGLALTIDAVTNSFPALKDLIQNKTEEELISLDLTSILGIVKYEVQSQDSGVMVNGRKGVSQRLKDFPSFLYKTDEPRIQSYPQILEFMRNKKCYISHKQDGQSATFFINQNEFGVCSRNQQKKENEFCQFWYVAKKYDIEQKLRSSGKNISIQGELCGPGIQKNHLKLKDFELFIFNVFDINERRFYNFNELIEFCNQLDLPTVPIINSNFIITDSMTTDDLVALSKYKYPNTDNWGEGIVVRTIEENFIQTKKYTGRSSFKCINPEYLLTGGN